MIRRIDWGLVAKVVLAGGVMGFLLYVVDPAEIARRAASAQVGWLVAALALLPLNLAAQGAVWYLLLRLALPDVGLRPAVGALMSGFALGLVTPAHAGEFVGRAYYLPGVDRWEVSVLVFTHRMLEMAACIDVGAVALVYYVGAHAPEPLVFWQGLSYAGAALAVILTVLALLPGLTHRLLTAVLRRETLRQRVAFFTRIGSVHAAALLATAFAGYLIFTTQFFFLLRAFEPEAPLQAGYLGIALVYFVKYLVPAVTFLDLGIREGAAVYFLGDLGFESAVAFNASFLLFCINLVLPAALGLPFVLRLRFGGEKSVSAEAPLSNPPTR